MAQFQVEVLIQAPVSAVWTRLTDWSAHARLAPLTTIRVIGSGDRPGSGFVSRTGIGPLAFDDPMEIEEFEPPPPTRLQPRAGTEIGVGAGTGAGTGTETGAGTGAESEAGANTGANTGVGTEVGTEVGTGVGTEVATDWRAESATGAETDSEPAEAATSSPTKPARPAARFRVRKTGWLLRGWVIAELWPAADRSDPDRVPVAGPRAVDPAHTPVPPDVTRLIWTEELRLPLEGVTRFADPLVALVAHAGYGAALRKLGREIEGETRG